LEAWRPPCGNGFRAWSTAFSRPLSSVMPMTVLVLWEILPKGVALYYPILPEFTFPAAERYDTIILYPTLSYRNSRFRIGGWLGGGLACRPFTASTPSQRATARASTQALNNGGSSNPSPKHENHNHPNKNCHTTIKLAS